MLPKSTLVISLIALLSLFFSSLPVHASPQPANIPNAVYTISGRITNGDGAGISGVTVTAYAGRKVFLPIAIQAATRVMTSHAPQTPTANPSAMTDANGNYILPDLPAGVYNLVPALNGVAFNPASVSITVPPNAQVQNFSQSYAEMLLVPAGDFPMGCDTAHNGGEFCSAIELPLHTVNLDAYLIDQYEVTNGQYVLCQNAGVCTPPSQYGSPTRLGYYNTAQFANYPVMWLSWYQASAYCAWAGKRLPTEAEWEKAARGSTIRAFPWGDQNPDCTLANAFDGANLHSCTNDTTLAGSYPAGASVYGAMDMAGNVWEWVNDWYQWDYYSDSPASNPQGPATGDYRVLRSGDWGSNRLNIRISNRVYDLPTDVDAQGFRCAKSLP